jgi:hypothetical protein
LCYHIVDMHYLTCAALALHSTSLNEDLQQFIIRQSSPTWNDLLKLVQRCDHYEFVAAFPDQHAASRYVCIPAQESQKAAAIMTYLRKFPPPVTAKWQEILAWRLKASYAMYLVYPLLVKHRNLVCEFVGQDYEIAHYFLDAIFYPFMAPLDKPYPHTTWYCAFGNFYCDEDSNAISAYRYTLSLLPRFAEHFLHE